MITCAVPDSAIKHKDAWYIPQDNRLCVLCRERNIVCLWPAPESSRKLKACHGCATHRVRCDEEDRPPRAKTGTRRAKLTNRTKLDEDGEEIEGGTEEALWREGKQADWPEAEEAENSGVVQDQVRYPLVEDFASNILRANWNLRTAVQTMSAASDEAKKTYEAMRKLVTKIRADRADGIHVFIPRPLVPSRVIVDAPGKSVHSTDANPVDGDNEMAAPSMALDIRFDAIPWDAISDGEDSD